MTLLDLQVHIIDITIAILVNELDLELVKSSNRKLIIIREVILNPILLTPIEPDVFS